MWKIFVVFPLLIANCYCECDTCDKHGHHHNHHHELFYHEQIFWYLALVAIKIKVIIVMGSIFTILLLSGKFYGLAKYIGKGEPEKIYVQAPSHHDHHYEPWSGRNLENTDFSEDMVTFVKMIRSMDLTKMAFNSMRITSEDCKKKFICKVDYNAKNNIILGAGLALTRDQGFDHYQTKQNVTSLEDCDNLYPLCKDQDGTE